MRKAVPLLAILSTLSAGVRADTPTTQTALDVPGRLRDLASRDPLVRDDARQTLMGLPYDQLDALKRDVAAARPLTPSQAEALQEVVTYVYTRGEIGKNPVGARGFLGVSFFAVDGFDLGDEPADQAPPKLLTGASFSGRLPGFVAYRYLSEGDVILSISTRGGKYATPDRQQLRATISSLRGGEPVTLRVLRGPKIINVSFPLDYAAPPDQQHMTTALTADAAYQAATNYWHEQFLPLIDADDT